MTFAHGPISQIPTTTPTLYAFKVEGHIDDDAAEAMAEFMLEAFDKHDSVDMLLDLSGFTGSDWDTMLDLDVIKSRFQALSSVRRYAVVGAPDKAGQMIEFMNQIIPVEARAFDAADRAEAWRFVGENESA
ncbi:MAG: STAS/SEC14 domain-containing protein [Pseudomonadota bacterium]